MSLTMLSLRKHLETRMESPEPPDVAAGEVRKILQGMAENAERATPGPGNDLREVLLRLSASLVAPVSDSSWHAAGEKSRASLNTWGEKAAQSAADSQQAMQQMIQVVATTSEALGSRDERYSREIGDLTGRLRGIAALDSMATVRRSILESAQALSSCVERMASEGREAVSKLKGQVADYEKKLQEAEVLASVDPLTGVLNRRGFERALAERIGEKKPFSLIVLDLNGFKAVNDQHGHSAGDELLKQFAFEVRSALSPRDVLARWGGDEFAAIVSGMPGESAAKAESLKAWAFGEYKFSTSSGEISVNLSASLGVANWNGIETAAGLLARADKQMYAMKQEQKAGQLPVGASR